MEMSKIEAISQDIVDKLKTVPEFTRDGVTYVGLAVGNTENDPINRDLPRPACWPVFTGVTVVDSSAIATQNVSVTYTFVLKVLVDYGDEASLIATHFPLLEKIITTVKGTGVNNLTGHKWAFDGMSLEDFDPDRMVWVMNLSVTTGL